MNDFYEKGPNFSGTYGLGEITKVKQDIIIPENFNGVRSYKELKDKINTIYQGSSEKQILSFTKGLFDLLDKIYEKTGEDPVLYLYFLYYGEKNKMSVDQITNRLKEFGIDTNSSTLEWNLKTRFGWNLTRFDRQLATIKNGNAADHMNSVNAFDIKERSEKLIQEVEDNFKGKVVAILTGELEEIYFKADKVAFILYKYGLIKDSSKEELKVFLLKFIDEGIGYRKIAKILNNLINHFDKNLDIRLVPTNIVHWTKD